MLNRRYFVYLSKLQKAKRNNVKQRGNIDSNKNIVMVSYLNSLRKNRKKR